MTGERAGLLLQVLRNPDSAIDLTAREWERLIRLGRRADLLARLGFLIAERGLLESIPDAPRRHFGAAAVIAGAQKTAVRREVRYIREALAGTGVDAVLLKGAAYVHANLRAAEGRVFSDVDILVPREALPAVENALMRHGWATTHHDAYDQRYYRQWMHELPPLRHIRRGTVIDVHHALLPLTARANPDSTKLLGASRALVDEPQLRILSPVDMVLHSATHLLFNEEWSHGLRDLVDLDSLLREFGSDPEFWQRLPGRARELDLLRPLHYALGLVTRLLTTPVPQDVIDRASAGQPPSPLRAFMDQLFVRAALPDDPASANHLAGIARQALYVRGHWLRMPPLLLAYHLGRKAIRREEKPEAE
jgi:hypothetical protein